jgi:hypothetical protein
MPDGILVPRPGLVDPATCSVCGSLRTALGDAIRANDSEQAADVVRTMDAHMRYGHPEDPRNAGLRR